MRNKFLTLACMGLALFASAAPAWAGGNELMFQKTQSLTTLAPSAVDGAADYIPVYDASADIMKKVLAANVSTIKAPVTLATDTTIDATYCGKTILMSGAGSSRTFTLPAATGTGCVLRFVVLAVNTSNYVITHAGSDAIKGGLVFGSDNASNAELGFETQSAVTITLNGTTKGGAGIGDYVELRDIGSALWAVSGQVTESGSETTPFS